MHASTSSHRPSRLVYPVLHLQTRPASVPSAGEGLSIHSWKSSAPWQGESWHASTSTHLPPSRTKPFAHTQLPTSPSPNMPSTHVQTRPLLLSSASPASFAGKSVQVAWDEHGCNEQASVSVHSEDPEVPTGHAHDVPSPIHGAMHLHRRPALSPICGAKRSMQVAWAGHGLVSQASMSSHAPSCGAYPVGHVHVVPSPWKGSAHWQYLPSSVLLNGAGKSVHFAWLDLHGWSRQASIALHSPPAPAAKPGSQMQSLPSPSLPLPFDAGKSMQLTSLPGHGCCKHASMSTQESSVSSSAVPGFLHSHVRPSAPGPAGAGTSLQVASFPHGLVSHASSSRHRPDFQVLPGAHGGSKMTKPWPCGENVLPPPTILIEFSLATSPTLTYEPPPPPPPCLSQIPPPPPPLYPPPPPPSILVPPPPPKPPLA